MEVVAGPGESLTGSTAAVFPPGLLAANPSLANAGTGSLVVVGGDHGGHNAIEKGKLLRNDVRFVRQKVERNNYCDQYIVG